MYFERIAGLYYVPEPQFSSKDILLGCLYLYEDGHGEFIPLFETYDVLEKEGVPSDVLEDLLIGIKEEVEELGADFDFDKYTKFWVNSFRFFEP